jgi:hypothetical protein
MVFRFLQAGVIAELDSKSSRVLSDDFKRSIGGKIPTSLSLYLPAEGSGEKRGGGRAAR